MTHLCIVYKNKLFHPQEEEQIILDNKKEAVQFFPIAANNYFVTVTKHITFL